MTCTHCACNFCVDNDVREFSINYAVLRHLGTNDFRRREQPLSETGCVRAMIPVAAGLPRAVQKLPSADAITAAVRRGEPSSSCDMTHTNRKHSSWGCSKYSFSQMDPKKLPRAKHLFLDTGILHPFYMLSTGWPLFGGFVPCFIWRWRASRKNMLVRIVRDLSVYSLSKE